MSNELGTVVLKLTTEDTGLTQGLQGAKAGAEGLGNSFKSLTPIIGQANAGLGSMAGSAQEMIGSIGGGGLLGVAGAAGIAAAAIIKLGMAGGAFVTQIAEVSNTTGLSTEKTLFWANAFERVGGSIDSLSTSSVMLQRQIETLNQAVENGTKLNDKQAELYNLLGGSLKGVNGELLSSGEALDTIIPKMAEMTDSASRAQLGVDVFGRSWGRVSSIVSEYSSIAPEASKSSQEMADKMGNAQEKALAYNSAMTDLGESFKRISLDALPTTVSAINDVAWAVEHFIDGWKQLITLSLTPLHFVLDLTATISNLLGSGDAHWDEIIKLGKGGGSQAPVGPAMDKNFSGPTPADALAANKYNTDFATKKLNEMLTALDKLGPSSQTYVDGLEKAVDSQEKAAAAAAKVAANMASLEQILTTMLGKIRSAASALFAQPTVEIAKLQLQADKLQATSDSIQVHLQPSIDALGTLKDGIIAAADASKLALQGQLDAITAARVFVTEAQAAFTSKYNAIDDAHQAALARITKQYAPAWSTLTPQQKATTQENNAYAQQTANRKNEQRDITDQTKALDAQQKALEASVKAIDKETAARTKIIDAQVKADQDRIDKAKKQVTKVADTIKAYDDQIAIMKDTLVASDATLLTQSEQKDAFHALATKTSDLTTQLDDMVDGVKTRFIPGFDAVIGAGGPLELLDTNGLAAALAIGGLGDAAIAAKTKLDSIAASGLSNAQGAATGSGQSGASLLKKLRTPAPHATGLDYVPYDNYPALLHVGERVLTAAQASERSGDIHVHLEGAIIAGQFDFERMVGAAVAKTLDRGGLRGRI